MVKDSTMLNNFECTIKDNGECFTITMNINGNEYTGNYSKKEIGEKLYLSNLDAETLAENLQNTWFSYYQKFIEIVIGSDVILLETEAEIYYENTRKGIKMIFDDNSIGLEYTKDSKVFKGSFTQDQLPQIVSCRHWYKILIRIFEQGEYQCDGLVFCDCSIKCNDDECNIRVDYYSKLIGLNELCLNLTAINQ